MIKSCSILLLFMFSCAHEQPKEDIFTVALEKPLAEEKPIITNRISTDYGPSPEGGPELASNEKQSQRVVALDLYPALYNSLGYVSTFIELEKLGLKIDIVSSTGFSSIIAALYAKYGLSNMLEWKTFELYQMLGSKKPFSEDWTRELEKFLKKEFSGLKMNQLKKLLVVPFLKDGKAAFNPNQTVVSALLKAVDLSQNSNMLLVNDYDYLERLKKYGADQVYRISFLPSKIRLKHPDGYIFGVYSRLQGSSHALAGAEDSFFYDSALEGNIDAFQNLSDTLYQSQDENREFAEKVQKDLEEMAGNI